MTYQEAIKNFENRLSTLSEELKSAQAFDARNKYGCKTWYVRREIEGCKKQIERLTAWNAAN